MYFCTHRHTCCCWPACNAYTLTCSVSECRICIYTLLYIYMYRYVYIQYMCTCYFNKWCIMCRTVVNGLNMACFCPMMGSFSGSHVFPRPFCLFRVLMWKEVTQVRCKVNSKQTRCLWHWQTEQHVLLNFTSNLGRKFDDKVNTWTFPWIDELIFWVYVQLDRMGWDMRVSCVCVCLYLCRVRM